MRVIQRRQAWHWIPVVAMVVIFGANCATYGGQTVGKEGTASGEVQTDGEHCMVRLPEGWTWLPASWTAVSPRKTQLTFTESLYGRPSYPEWEEARQAAIDDVTQRMPNAEITETDNLVRIDYGESGGLTVLRKFDRVGCQLTFSQSNGAREAEIEQWEQIISSLVRTSPTENFTPTP